MDKPRKPRSLALRRIAELGDDVPSLSFAAFQRSCHESVRVAVQLPYDAFTARRKNLQVARGADHTRVDSCCLRRSRRAAMTAPDESPSIVSVRVLRCGTPSTSNSSTRANALRRDKLRAKRVSMRRHAR